MNLKPPVQQQQPFSNSFSKTFHKENKKTRLPSIHNENQCHNEVNENRYCHNMSRMTSNKGVAMPLTIRQSACNQLQNQLFQNNIGGGHKKIVRPLAIKPKSLITKYSNEKKSTIQDRSSSCNHRMSMKLEKLSFKNTVLLCPTTDIKQCQLGLSTINFDKGTSNNNSTHHKMPFRDRTNSCRVSFKRVFPVQQKQQTQENNVSIFFRHDEQKLSTIPGDSDHEQSNFLSMDSFTELIS